MTRRIKAHRYFKLESCLCVAIVELLYCSGAFAQGDPTFFPANSQFIDSKTGAARINPNTRQLTNPTTGRPDFSGNTRVLTDTNGKSTFQGYSRKLTDPVTGASTFTGYSIKLTDPITGGSTFKGYGQNPLMKDRQSAPDFHWNSNVDSSGKSQYTGFSQNPLTTPDGKSTFTGNNRRLTDEAGRPTFIGNTRQLVDPEGRIGKDKGSSRQDASEEFLPSHPLDFNSPTFDTGTANQNHDFDDKKFYGKNPDDTGPDSANSGDMNSDGKNVDDTNPENKIPLNKYRSEVEHHSSEPQNESGF